MNRDGAKVTANSYAHAVKGTQGQKEVMDDIPSLVLEDSCLNQKVYSLCLLGKVKEFTSLTNLNVVLAKEGYANIKIKYIGGFWDMIEFRDEETNKMFQSNLAAGTWFSQIIQAHNDFTIDERVTWVEIEGVPCKWWSRNTFSRIASRWGTLLNGDELEDDGFHKKRICILPGWVPDFKDEIDEEYDLDYGSHEDEVKRGDLGNLKDLEGDSDVEEVLELKFKEESNEHTLEENLVRKAMHSLRIRLVFTSFTPNEDVDASVEAPDILLEKTKENDDQEDGGSVEKQIHLRNEALNDAQESICSGLFKKSEVPRTGGSILQLIDDLVNVGQTTGYDMTSSVSNSDGILCVWDPNMFQKMNETVSDYFTMEGEVVTVGDFNEVRDNSERFGSVFNKQGVKAFNSFISNAGLVEVPLGERADVDVKRIQKVVSLLQEVEKVDLMEVAQKAKIKWAIKGDESSKYYHNVLNKKRGRIAIRGVLVDAPGPDGFTFSFYRRYWNLIESDGVDAVKWFFQQGTILKGDDMLKKFRFGEKWCKWIQSCLHSSRGSNGSPTKEFQFYKGHKQGDPLSPFLFILVMEILHVLFQRMVDAGLFKRIKEAFSLHISHLFYADDAIFMGQWNLSNIDTITRVLEFFHRASGLHINMNKSKLMGISVDISKVEQTAAKIGCLILKTSFTYLGSRVGGLMSRIQSWSDIIASMVSRLSRWKLKTLSIGERLTLLNSILGAMPIYQMSIFKVPMKVRWENVMASKDTGGLGVSSLFALNKALMFKWVWWFISQKSSLWASVIKALHGEDGKIGKKIKTSYSSIWLSIIHEVELLKSQGIDLLCFIIPKLGNGMNTSFWDVAWRGDVAFKVLIPRLYALETMKNIDVASKLSHGSSEFSMSSVRKVIDATLLPKGTTKTRWIKAVPIKINVHAWKVKHDCLPTRVNISRRGMEIESMLCPMCNNAVESSRHLFFSCYFISEIMHKITRWWDMDYMEINSFEEWLEWISSIRLPLKQKQIFEGMCYILWWYIWKWRNKKIFGRETPSKAIIFYEVVSLLFIGFVLDVKLSLVG
nr:RNA-directed DNA polymerase, eukaryota, reverse transcriptase zinc-binding domain protein [Tanacetum cinerariifolium]